MKPRREKLGDAARVKGTMVSAHLDWGRQRAPDLDARLASALGPEERRLVETPILGEASAAGRAFASLVRRLAAGTEIIRRPYCLVAGGETTVTVSGKGLGGRAQEFAAAAACELAGLQKTWIAAVGTDGTDGPTDAAGAVVSGATLASAERKQVDLRRALARHDTYPALRALNSHIVTGPTGTNVNDLYLLLAL